MTAPPLASPARSRSSAALGLLWTIVRTDFKARYHGTLGGFGWALLKPLALFAVLATVFSFVFDADPRYRQKLLLGLFLWDFFAESTRGGLVALHRKAFLLTKARLPTWIPVAAALANPLLTLTVLTVVGLTALALAGASPSVAALGLYLGYVLLLAVVAFGFGLGASVLQVRYRDLDQVWEVATQAGFFLAPVVWPLGAIPERLHFWLYLWPPTPAIEFARAVLVEGQAPSLRAHLLFLAVAFAVLAGGALLHRRLAPRAAEYL